MFFNDIANFLQKPSRPWSRAATGILRNRPGSVQYAHIYYVGASDVVLIRDQTQPCPNTMSERHKTGDHEREFDVAVEEAKPRLKQPPLYRVVLINDDYTPMDFVVNVLESVFGMERVRATQVMLEVHTRGKGVCGVYNFEIAETKVAQVMGIAKQHQHPLLCTMEES